jgi:BASS family bile acid:Na+ symporter
MLHSIGFLVGYLVPRFGLKYTEKTARTISIETGMQNSALAVVLAQSIGAHPLAALPGALSATVHSCLGSILAAYWRFQDSRNVKENVNDGNDKSENAWASYL